MARDKFPYCERHRKYAYRSNEEAAASAMRVVTVRKRFSLRAYECKIDGVKTGAWHLTKRI